MQLKAAWAPFTSRISCSSSWSKGALLSTKAAMASLAIVVALFGIPLGLPFGLPETPLGIYENPYYFQFYVHGAACRV